MLQTTVEFDTRATLAESKFLESYSRLKPDNTYETWDDSVERVMRMHREKYADRMTYELDGYMREAEDSYKRKAFLGSQRALQFGGAEILRKNARMYNCTASYADRPRFFAETFWLLLCGCGVGFSVQTQHIAKLPVVQEPTGRPIVHIVADSIEGWADAAQALFDSYFRGTPPVKFNFDLVREKGAFISGGFKAPGPEPLRKALDKIRPILDAAIGRQMADIEVYDCVMHLSDAVLSGGVRRAATICIFSKTSEAMLKAKTGNWFVENPQRGRSNNSVALLRSETTWEEFSAIMRSVEQFGEPGFVFLDDLDHLFNPCVEVGMKGKTEDGVSGWQGCNLCEISGAYCTTEELFFEACRSAAIMGTLQAGYTDFAYLGEASERIFRREALLGVSITGFMNSPDILLNADTLRRGAEIVKETNREVAALIGINPAARCTVVKPSGNASVLLQTASSTQGEHAKRYLRNVQYNALNEVPQLIQATNPAMVERSVWSQNETDVVISYPITPPKSSRFRQDIMGVRQLEIVRMIQENWIEGGKNAELCVDESLSHNVSNTITVDNWADVARYVYDNRFTFAGISFLAYSGDRDYAQAPFTEVLLADEIRRKHGLNWRLFDEVFEDVNYNVAIRRKPWHELSLLEKDCLILGKWNAIQETYVPIDWRDLKTKDYTDIDQLGAMACNVDPLTGVSNCA
jgi:ribonucleoside-diphosphate reductase alpha chain